MADFFISYNKADKAWAEWIAWQLEEASYSTVLQAWDFTPGTNFALKMDEAAKEAGRTIAVLSPDYLTSNFTAAEWAAAFAQDPRGKKGQLIPIRVHKCDPTGLLGPIVFQDLVGLDEDAAKAAVLAAVKRSRAKPDAKPPFPPTGRSVTSRPRFPGALPSIWNIPHRRNPNFTGREELLPSLHASLNCGDYAALTQAMHGLGGVGKTQAAIEYAYRYAGEYDAVMWVPAEDSAVLASHFAGLANVIGLQVDPADQSAAHTAVHRWLRENSRWLLIFDNAEAVNDIRQYLPQTGTGHVIITSRNPEWRRVAKPLAVQRFAPDEAIAFLLARAGKTGQHNEEARAAATLAEELGGLALALEQAAAYVETHGLSLVEYLRLFRAHREEVLSREVPPDYPHTMETVWALSFDAVTKDSPAAVELLTLLAHFAPDDVPLTLIRSGTHVLPQTLSAAAEDELALRNAVRALRRHSLIEVADDAISVHRIVQAATRRSLNEPERRRWAEIAIGVIHAALPKDPEDVSTWSDLSRLSPHVGTAAQHCETEGAGLEHAATCLSIVGGYLSIRGAYDSATLYLERAVQIDEARFGTEHPRVAIRLNNLGTVQQASGDLLKARANFERALKIDEDALGPDHPTIVKRINNLGLVIAQLGDPVAARPYIQRAVEMAPSAFGPGHPHVAKTVNSLGKIQYALGDMAGARKSFEQALAINEVALGRGHYEVALNLNNLAATLEAFGDKSGARSHYDRALQILLELFGEEHPITQGVRENLNQLMADADGLSSDSQ